MTVSELVEQYGSIRQAANAIGRARSTVRRWLAENPTKDVEPVKVVKPERTEGACLQLYDIHFPNESKENIAIAIDYAKSNFKIDNLVLGGDAADFHRISRWKKDPNSCMPFDEEIEYTRNGVAAISSAFPDAKRYFIKGNHEMRLETFLWNNAPELVNLKGMTVQEQLGLDEAGYTWIDNLKMKEQTGQFFSIGKLTMLHGHELGICPSVNPARQYFLRSFDNVMVGHVHKVDNHIANTISGKVLGAYVVGTLSNMHPEYRPQNDWVAGFAITEFDADGYFKVNNYKIINGRVL